MTRVFPAPVRMRALREIGLAHNPQQVISFGQNTGAGDTNNWPGYDSGLKCALGTAAWIAMLSR